VLSDIRSVFGKVSGTRGKKHDYLGMVFDFSAETSLKIHINMMIEEILSEADIGSITAPTPANNNLFKIGATSPTLSEDDKAYFHSTVTQLLYVAKRVRPVILLAVSFLSTRVINPTVSDLTFLV